MRGVLAQIGCYLHQYVRRGRNLLAAVAICATALGCAALPGARFVRADSVLERLAAQTACSRGITGDAALHLKGPFLDVKGQLLFKAQAPESLRFDLYSPLGVTVTALTSDGDKFALYDLAGGRFVYGAASTCNLAAFTRISIPPFALVEILRGRPPVLAHDPTGVRFRYARPLFKKGRYVIELTGDHDATETLWIEVADEDFDLPLEKQRLRLVRVRVEQKGHLIYEAELSDYKQRKRAPFERTADEIEMGIPPAPPTGPECTAELPGRISFNVGRGGYRLTLSSKEAFHNPPNIPGAYTQEIPGGVSVERSTCDSPGSSQ